MSNQNHSECAWCNLGRARQGLVLGVLGSLAIHSAFFLWVMAHDQPRLEPKEPRVIDLGTMIIKVPAKAIKQNEV